MHNREILVCKPDVLQTENVKTRKKLTYHNLWGQFYKHFCSSFALGTSKSKVARFHHFRGLVNKFKCEELVPTNVLQGETITRSHNFARECLP